MTRWLSLVLPLWLGMHGLASAQVASTTEATGASNDAAHSNLEEEEPEPWKGPRVKLGYRLYSLHDWQGGGAVNTGVFSGFLPTRQFRAGGGVEGGTRQYELGSRDGLFSGHLFAGYQHLGDLGRLLPYLVAIGEFGFTFGKRFHTPVSQTFRGVGAELGADIQLIRGLHVGLGVSYMVYTMDDLRYGTFGMRLSIGL